MIVIHPMFDLKPINLQQPPVHRQNVLYKRKPSFIKMIVLSFVRKNSQVSEEIRAG